MALQPQTSLRLAELLATVALAADAGAALAPETSLRTCLVSSALARVCVLSEEEMRDVYFAFAAAARGLHGERARRDGPRRHELFARSR